MIRSKLKPMTLLPTLFLLITSLATYAQEDPLSGLDDYVKKSMRQWQVPGVAIAIVKDDTVILAKGYGTRTVGENQPVDEKTLFAIGSNTKLFTASALAVLVGEGKIDWNDRLATRLPGFQVGSDLVTTHGTLRDALSHRTGVQNIGLTWRLNPSRSRQALLKRMRYLPSKQDFRSGFHYSNDMFLVAGEIIPEVSGVSWDDFIKKRFFKPLGMKNSNTSIKEFGRYKNIATPHMLSNNKTVTVPYFNVDPVAPAGSINSSAADMAQWLRFQLNNGKVGDQVVVQEEALNETRRLHNSLSVDIEALAKEFGLGCRFSGYGLGVVLCEIGGYKVYSHGGRIDGMVSSMLFVPELKLGVVVLSNIGTLYAYSLRSWILDRYIGAEYTDWSDSFLKSQNTPKQAGKENIHRLKENATENTEPSLPLASYAGTYTNELAGNLIITVEDNRLSYRLAETGRGSMSHLHFDTFIARLTEPLLEAEMGEKAAQFHLNIDGSVKSIVMSFYDTPLTYLRKR